MNPTILLAQGLSGKLGVALVAVFGIVFVIILFMAIWASRYTKVGPNQVLVISGRKHRIMEQDGTARPPTASQLYTSNGSDYFESGNLACDGLVCIVSPAPAGSEYGSSVPGQGYCSKPCVSNADCYESETGLVCRQMVLDPVFLETLDAATRQRYLADIQYSSYCAVPR